MLIPLQSMSLTSDDAGSKLATAVHPGMTILSLALVSKASSSFNFAGNRGNRITRPAKRVAAALRDRDVLGCHCSGTFETLRTCNCPKAR